MITPLNVFNSEDINQAEVVNTLRLLQSLDTDGDADNGIQISAEVHSAAMGLSIDFLNKLMIFLWKVAVIIKSLYLQKWRFIIFNKPCMR